MKTKIIILIVSLMFAYSCKKNETTSEVKKDEVKVEQKEDVKVKITEEDLKKVEVKEVKKEEVKAEAGNYVEDYTKFLATLSEKDIKSIPKAVNYFNEKLKGVDGKLVDACYAKFEEFYEKVNSAEGEVFANKDQLFQTKVYEVLNPGSTSDDNGKPKKEHIDYANSLKENGFELGAMEGNFFLQKNNKFVNDKIKDIVSPVLKEFLTKTQTEKEEGFITIGAILIPIKSLAERIVFWENFAKKNGDFVLINQVNEMLKDYKIRLFTGMESNPVFNYETDVITNEFQTAYKFLIENHSNTEIGKLTKEFYSIIEKNEFKDSEELKKFIEKNKLQYE